MPDDRSIRRAEWMAQAQAGDEQAYRALLEDVSAALGGFLRRRLATPDDAADVLQETLVTLHRARHTYDPRRPFDPWMFAIARHVLIDHVRRRRRIERFEASEESLPDTAAPEPTVSRDGLIEALERLPAAQRQAFELVKLEGLSVEQAAARAGTTTGALKVRAHRAYKALRQLLEGR